MFRPKEGIPKDVDGITKIEYFEFLRQKWSEGMLVLSKSEPKSLFVCHRNQVSYGTVFPLSTTSVRINRKPSGKYHIRLGHTTLLRVHNSTQADFWSRKIFGVENEECPKATTNHSMAHQQQQKLQQQQTGSLKRQSESFNSTNLPNMISLTDSHVNAIEHILGTPEKVAAVGGEDAEEGPPLLLYQGKLIENTVESSGGDERQPETIPEPESAVEKETEKEVEKPMKNPTLKGDALGHQEDDNNEEKDDHQLGIVDDSKSASGESTISSTTTKTMTSNASVCTVIAAKNRIIDEVLPDSDEEEKEEQKEKKPSVAASNTTLMNYSPSKSELMNILAERRRRIHHDGHMSSPSSDESGDLLKRYNDCPRPTHKPSVDTTHFVPQARARLLAKLAEDGGEAPHAYDDIQVRHYFDEFADLGHGPLREIDETNTSRTESFAATGAAPKYLQIASSSNKSVNSLDDDKKHGGSLDQKKKPVTKKNKKNKQYLARAPPKNHFLLPQQEKQHSSKGSVSGEEDEKSNTTSTQKAAEPESSSSSTANQNLYSSFIPPPPAPPALKLSSTINALVPQPKNYHYIPQPPPLPVSMVKKTASALTSSTGHRNNIQEKQENGRKDRAELAASLFPSKHDNVFAASMKSSDSILMDIVSKSLSLTEPFPADRLDHPISPRRRQKLPSFDAIKLAAAATSSTSSSASARPHRPVDSHQSVFNELLHAVAARNKRISQSC